MDFLNEALENDGGESIDHSHTPLNVSQGKTSSPLSSMASTPEPVPNTPLREPRHQIPTKLPPRFQHIAWLIMAYLAGYDAGVSDLLSYSEAMNSSNAAQWKLSCDEEFQSLDKNNT